MQARTTLSILTLALLLFASACNGNGGGGGEDMTSFTGFVQNLAATPVDNADPVAIDGTEFTFSEDPTAFDALFQ